MACQSTLQVTCQKYITGNYRWLSVKKKSGPKFIIILFDQWYNYKEDQASFSKSSPRLYIQIMLKMHKKTRKIEI